MTESSIFDPGHSQHQKPGIKNKPSAGRGALAFNPLHPSMELPPEQLIRLLGMESKKTRKHMKTRRSSKQQKSLPAINEQKTPPSPDQQDSCRVAAKQKTPASQDPQQSHRVSDEQKTPPSPNQQDSCRIAAKQKTPASQDSQQSHRVADEQKTHRLPSQGAEKKTTDRQQRPEPQQVTPPSHPMEYERNQPAVFDKRIPAWLLPALVTGLVAGVIISAALFWYQTSPAAKQKAPAPVVSSEPQNRRIAKQQPNSQRVKRNAAPGSTKTATLPAQVPAKAARSGNDANRQAALKAEHDRLRSAAEQRLTEQLTKMKVNRELADIQAPPADEYTPAAAATLSAAAEPSFDQAVVNEPAAAGGESPPSEQAPVEIPEPETLPVVTAAPAVGSDRNGGMLEKSTGSVDSFEQDTASDVAATVEQDSESNISPSLDVNTTTAFTPPTERDTVSDVTPSSGDELDAEQSTSGTSDETSSSAAENSALF
ncbi:MAG: hypothetical protein U9Q19_10065 [Pseudomonadota bacterium]|nr:hypothetical protein [Pseudomonadota bacterium]